MRAGAPAALSVLAAVIVTGAIGAAAAANAPKLRELAIPADAVAAVASGVPMDVFADKTLRSPHLQKNPAAGCHPMRRGETPRADVLVSPSLHGSGSTTGNVYDHLGIYVDHSNVGGTAKLTYTVAGHALVAVRFQVFSCGTNPNDVPGVGYFAQRPAGNSNVASAVKNAAIIRVFLRDKDTGKYVVVRQQRRAVTVIPR
jgi:hypothetical protein